MSDQIKKSDLFEEGLFNDLNTDIKEQIKLVDELTGSYTDLMSATRDKLAKTNANTVADLKTITKETTELTKQQQLLVNLDIKKQKLQQENLKTDQQTVKVISAERKELEAEAKALEKSNKERAKSAKILSDNNSEYKKAVKALGELKSQLKELEIRGQTSGKLYKALGQEFVVLNGKVRDAEEGVGEFQRNVGNYPKQLKEITRALQGLEPGTEEFNKLAAKAGELKDRIGDAKDSVKAFANESKVTTAKNLFGQILGDIKDLDFKGASDKARQFAGVISSISFAEIIGGIKSFGSALANVGKALLLNPIVLFAAVIGGLVYAFNGLIDSFDAGNKSLASLNEELKGVTESTNELKKATRDLRIENDIASGKLTENEGKKLKAVNKFKDEYVKILEEQRDKTKKFNDDIKAEREDDGFQGTKRALEALGVETELTKKQKLGLLEIEQEYGKKKKELRILLDEEEKAIQLDSDNAAKKAAEDKAKKAAEDLKKLQDAFKFGAKTEVDVRISLLDKIDQAEIDLIENDKERSVAQAIFNAKQDIKEVENTQAREDEKARLILLIRQKLLEDLTKLHKLEGIMDDSGVEEHKKREEEKKKATEDAIKERFRLANMVIDEIEKEIQRESDLRQKAADDAIKRQENNISTQQKLAEKGLANTLAFEEKQKAQLELAKKQEAEKEIKRLRAVAFAKSYVAYLDSTKNPQQALTNAIRDSLLIKLIQGAFYEGTENVGESLGKPVFAGKDGHVVRVDKSERIMTGEQNKMVGDLSNDELANLAKSYHDGVYLPKYMIDSGSSGSTATNFHNSAMLNQLMSVKKELSSIKEVISNKKETSVNIDNVGNVITSEVENGFRKTVLIKKRKSRL